MNNLIFCFGSNLRGIHGKGAAYHAVKHYGALYYIPEGIQGRSYAIPTKNWNLVTLPLQDISTHVKKFKQYASDHEELTLFVTAIGTGLAGYSHKDIAPMFRDVPLNCILPKEWVELLKTKHRFHDNDDMAWLVNNRSI